MRVDVAALAVGSLVTAAAPALAVVANDEVAGAPALDASSTTELDATTATTGVEDPVDCTGGGSVWYTVTPDVDETIVIDTFGSDYDTLLGVYMGSPGDLTLVACNDDTFDSLESLVAFNAEADTTYYVVVSSCCDETATAGILSSTRARAKCRRWK